MDKKTYTSFEFIVSSYGAWFKLLIQYVTIYFKVVYVKGRYNFATEVRVV